jgi:DNA polymerase III subunit delta
MAKRPAPSAARSGSELDPSMRIVVLHGKDNYRIGELTRELAALLREAHGEIEEYRYDGAAVQLADVLDELRSYGLIQRHKFVILDNADRFLAGKGGDDEDEEGGGGKGAVNRGGLERYAAAPVDDATLLMRAETWRPGNLDKAVKKVGAIIKCEPIKEPEALAWCIKECAPRHGVKLDAAAAERLVALCGADCGRLDNEIAKLAAYIGPGGAVTTATVAELVGATREDEVWSIQGPLASGDAAAAVARIRELMRLSRQPDTTLTLITWSLCDLMRKVHGAAQLQRQGVNPFEVGKRMKIWGDARDAILGAARRIEPSDAAMLLDAALRTDFHNKTGRGLPIRSLEALAVQIADTIGGRTAAGARS